MRAQQLSLDQGLSVMLRDASVLVFRFSLRHPVISFLAIAGSVEICIGDITRHPDLMAFGLMGLLSAIAVWVNRKNPPRPFRRISSSKWQHNRN